MLLLVALVLPLCFATAIVTAAATVIIALSLGLSVSTFYYRCAACNVLLGMQQHLTAHVSVSGLSVTARETARMNASVCASSTGITMDA